MCDPLSQYSVPRVPCKNAPECFCYCCGRFIQSLPSKKFSKLPDKSRPITDEFKEAFYMYFGPCQVGEQDKWWAPKRVCANCSLNLLSFRKGERKSLRFSIPVQWREPTNHDPINGDCFFCTSKVNGKHSQNKIYGWGHHASQVVLREKGENPPEPPLPISVDDDEDETMDDELSDPTYEAQLERGYVGVGKPIQISQTMLDSIVISMDCGINGAELFGSIASNLNWLIPGTTITYANRYANFAQHYEMTNVTFQMKKEEPKKTKKELKDETKKLLNQQVDPPANPKEMAKGGKKRQTKTKPKEKVKTKRQKKEVEMEDRTFKLVYCKDIDSLFAEFEYEYIPDHWRLWIDSSASGLKAVLLHNEEDINKRLPAIIVAYSSNMPEEYAGIKQVLELIKYRNEDGTAKWKFSADFKMINVVSGMMKSYCKHNCYLCDFQGRKEALHFINHKWKRWTKQNTKIGSRCIINEPLYMPDEIILKDLHIKLGLFQQFIKQLNHSSEAYKYYKHKFEKTPPEKLEGGILNGPQVQSLMDDYKFVDALKAPDQQLKKKQPRRESQIDEANVPLQAWLSYVNVCRNFLGNHRSVDYKSIVKQLLVRYGKMGCHMSLKLHMLESHLDDFPTNIGAVSDQHGERFHQTIKPTERRFRGKVTTNFLADHCYMTKKRQHELVHRKIKKGKHIV